MNLKPRIEFSAEKKLIGLKQSVSLTHYDVVTLWKKFFLHQKDILNILSDDLISMSDYPDDYFSHFNAATTFQKWAAAEVSSFDNVPTRMETFIIPSGCYAVFSYKGSNNDHRIFDYIYKVWIPQSKYQLDHRPHFEVLGENYRNGDPASEEDIYIPIILK